MLLSAGAEEGFLLQTEIAGNAYMERQARHVLLGELGQGGRAAI